MRPRRRSRVLDADRVVRVEVGDMGPAVVVPGVPSVVAVGVVEVVVRPPRLPGLAPGPGDVQPTVVVERPVVAVRVPPGRVVPGAVRPLAREHLSDTRPGVRIRVVGVQVRVAVARRPDPVGAVEFVLPVAEKARIRHRPFGAPKVHVGVAGEVTRRRGRRRVRQEPGVGVPVVERVVVVVVGEVESTRPVRTDRRVAMGVLVRDRPVEADDPNGVVGQGTARQRERPVAVPVGDVLVLAHRFHFLLVPGRVVERPRIPVEEDLALECEGFAGVPVPVGRARVEFVVGTARSHGRTVSTGLHNPWFAESVERPNRERATAAAILSRDLPRLTTWNLIERGVRSPFPNGRSPTPVARPRSPRWD